MPAQKNSQAQPHLSVASVVAAFVVAAATGVGVFLISNGSWRFSPVQTVTVVGKGQKTAGVALTNLEFAVQSTARTSAKESLGEVSNKMTSIREALTAVGVLPTDIVNQGVRVSRRTDNANLIEATQSVRILVRDSEQLTLVQEAVQANGGTVVNSPESGQPTIAHARIRARQEAEADARDRAVYLAQQKGKILGKLIHSSAAEEVTTLSSSSGASSQSSKKDKEVVVRVTATYELQ